MFQSLTKSSELLKVSVIIPFYKDEGYLKECISHCLKLDYTNYEIIVVSHSALSMSNDGVRVLLVDNASQGSKKDAGIKVASGEVCAFVDDDAYPSPDWLKNAVKYFEDSDVGAVCGPGLTPESDSLLQKASGVVYSSFGGGGILRFRYVPEKTRYVNEGPGYNMLVRKSLLKEVGGIATNLRSGEDTLLCKKIREVGKKILYAPDVIVYHHRRPLFTPHLKQAKTYALHRGYLAKKEPATSANLFYMLPFIFLVGLGALAVLSVHFSFAFDMLLFAVITYLAVCLTSAVHASKDARIAVLAFLGTVLTHLVYAFGFIQGLLIEEIGERPSH
jgi:cellulose synthase/poly-beta-1,6-N-acetylglucosamine synthase-like glycosyltransferase